MANATGDKDLETQKLKAEVAYKSARAMKEKYTLAELQGEMHRSEDVRMMTEQLIYETRSMLVALPGRVAVDLATIDSAEEISIYLRDEINFILTALSDFKYDPDKYMELVRERQGWKANEDGGDSEPE